MRKYQFIGAPLILLAAALAFIFLRSYEEERAAAALQEMGAAITRDQKRPGKPVTEVAIGCGQRRDVVLTELAPLTQLRSLTISCSREVDPDLKGLAELKQL